MLLYKTNKISDLFSFYFILKSSKEPLQGLATPPLGTNDVATARISLRAGCRVLLCSIEALSHIFACGCTAMDK